jgi:hypothetical protein
VCVGGTRTSVTSTLQCDGPQQVSVHRLEVQTPIRKRDRRCREGKERRHDTRTHEQERGGGASHGMRCGASIAFLSRPE